MARIEQVLAGEKSWGAYALDVLGHFGLGVAWSIGPIATVVFAADFGFGLAMAVGQPCALAGGTWREWRQYRKTGKLHLLDRVLDVLHHVLGPPVAWAIVIGIRAAIS
jgi:hypothetical protein